MPVKKTDFSILLGMVILIIVGLAGTYSVTQTPKPVKFASPTPGKNTTLQIGVLTITLPPTPTHLPSSGGSPASANTTVSPTPAPTSPSTPPSGSMLCGTNLGLFNSSDSFLTSAVQAVTKQQLHVGTIRMPIRSPAGNTVEFQAAQAIKNMGAIPLIILHESGGTGDVANDKQIITKMNQIFGNSTVYYEMGNEPTGGYAPYIANWNAMVGQLKTVASPNSKFGGPVWFENFSSGEIAGMAQFVHTANPKPDFISWHEYTCGHADSAQYCYDHVGTAPGHNWSVHIQNTRSAIQANGDVMPPIFITEWNYDSAAPGTGADPRIAQLNSMHFMKTALQELKKDGVFAAYQYVLNTNPDYNLLNGTSLTGFGQDFGATCAGL